MNDLAAECRKVLLDNMRPGLRAGIDTLLAQGQSHRAIVEFVRASARLAGAPSDGGLVVLQVEAYLAAKAESGD